MVSMNMWGFKPELFQALEKGFINFLSKTTENDLKKEYLLPMVVGELVKDGVAEVFVLKTMDRWFGVTYKEDKESVVKSIQVLIDKGDYPAKLFA
jgi:NDP-sugar pyrophosphorylase family protein